jgi:hypothetical protein
MQCLRQLRYGGNEVGILHPAMHHWLNNKKSTPNVYTDNQNVHDHDIQHTANESIVNFIKCYDYDDSNINVTHMINNLQTDEKIKNLLRSYAKCTNVHSSLHLTFANVLGPVLDYINNHPSKTELVKILAEEIKDCKDKCFQGRLSRLIGVLSGYHPSVNINISQNEQISNVVIMLRRKHYDKNVDEFVKIFATELRERNYSDNIIDEWIEYVVDNY